jgi:asparagine synthase (glutamine-hydrolysing)
LGVKPLYWAEHQGAVVAGSAPRALLSILPDLRHDLDRVALAQFLTLLWIPHPRTPWSGIKKLPPGSAMSVEPGRIRQWRYWAMPEPTRNRLDPGDLREALDGATARQLLSDVPVGLLLSGGLDSSLILALVAQHQHGDIPAVAAGYDTAAQRLETTPDDLGYARRVAARLPQVSLREVLVDDRPEDHLEALALHFDDPVADPAAITMYRLAQASPTKVLLSGVGGEELFAGYPRHLRLATARRAAALPAALRRGAGAVAPLLHGGRPGVLHTARRNGQKLARAVGDERTVHYWRLASQLTFAELAALVPDTAAQAFDELDAQTAPLTTVTIQQALAFDRDQFLPNLNLSYVDKASMAAGVEVRVPLLDEAVVDLAATAAADRFVAGAVSKVPLRTAATGLVPQEVLDRPKSGFGGPVRSWFRGDRSGSLRARVEAVSDAGLVDGTPADRLVAEAETGRQDAALAAWALVCLQVWHQEHRSTALVGAAS